MADKKKNPVTEGKKSFNWPDKIFGAAVLILSILVFLIIAYPLWFIIIASISNSNMVNLGKVTFLPKDIRFYGYQQIMDDARIWMGYANTILYVVAGTILNMAVTMPAAYALSRRNFKARNKVMFYFVFTMFFSGGLVPLYMTVSSLGLISTKTILIIFVAVNTYNLIIARTFIENSIPEDLYEAAVLDGCSHFNYFVKVVLPLSKAVISVLILYYAGTVVRTDTLEKYPGLADTLEKLTGQISDDEMRNMNYQVEVEGKDEKEVAKAFLIEKGLIKK